VAFNNAGAGIGIYKNTSIPPVGIVNVAGVVDNIAIPTNSAGLGIFGAIQPSTVPAKTTNGLSTVLGNLYGDFSSDLAKLVPAPMQSTVQAASPNLTQSVSQNPGQQDQSSESSMNTVFKVIGVYLGLKYFKII
jgi:hypothetical protein